MDCTGEGDMSDRIQIRVMAITVSQLGVKIVLACSLQANDELTAI